MKSGVSLLDDRPRRTTSTTTIWNHAPAHEEYHASRSSTHCKVKNSLRRNVGTSGRELERDTDDASDEGDEGSGGEEKGFDRATRGHDESDDNGDVGDEVASFD
ncbi:MAG: hypothetical protein Q9216_000896 [Gyalolechia sp. 2 TL-2023]